MHKPLLQQEFSAESDHDALASLLEGSRAWSSILANACSFLYWSVPRLNWIGFYLLENNSLELGPFHGRPACISIAMGQGVCGTAASRGETIVVPDVDAFPGHIACDSASRSEMVIPLFVNGIFFGVFDIDSPELDRFDPDTVTFFERCAAIIVSRLEMLQGNANSA